jgi:MOSC domain-containing protein YiiM
VTGLLDKSMGPAGLAWNTEGVDGSTPELCSKCGFDSRRWKRRDAATLFGELGWWWAHATDGFSVDELNRRPAPGVWSVLEYGLHTALAAAVIRAEVEEILAGDGCTLDVDFDIGDATEDNWAVLERWATLADLEREGAASAVSAGRRNAPWANVGYAGNRALQAEAYLIHDAHDASHHMMDVSRGLAALSTKPAAEGRVMQVNVSDGGVPKGPVERAALTARGVEGDRQRDRKHHGRPFQAVCLWSADVIDELSAAGHPIGSGCAGENLTLRGVNWGSLRPGALIRVGEALVELSFPAVPCHNQTQWFSDGDFSRIAHEVNPQWARWYGWVREPGEAHAGGRVVVQT